MTDDEIYHVPPYRSNVTPIRPVDEDTPAMKLIAAVVILFSLGCLSLVCYAIYLVL